MADTIDKQLMAVQLNLMAATLVWMGLPEEVRAAARYAVCQADTAKSVEEIRLILKHCLTP